MCREEVEVHQSISVPIGLRRTLKTNTLLRKSGKPPTFTLHVASLDSRRACFGRFSDGCWAEEVERWCASSVQPDLNLVFRYDPANDTAPGDNRPLMAALLYLMAVTVLRT